MQIKNDYIRVTDLLKPWQNFGSIDPEVLENKARIGTNVHEAIANYSIGFPVAELDEREEKYFKCYQRWHDKEAPLYDYMEQRYYDDDLMVTGQVDAVVKLKDYEGLHIMDFKTSSLPSHNTWHIQLGWYYMLARKQGLEINDTAFVLQLKENKGEARLYPYYLSQDILRTCLAIYDAYMYFNPLKEETK